MAEEHQQKRQRAILLFGDDEGCGTCGRECWLDGFTISDFEPAKLLAAAVVDQARKHRKRSPDEVGKIESQRRVAGG